LITVMLKTFALDPELFADFQHFLLLRDKFGVPEGRLIAKFPGKWKKQVREFCDAAVSAGRLKEVRRNTVINWMAKYGDRDSRLIATGAVWEDGPCWCDNASANQHHFDCVISSRVQTGEKCLHADEDGGYAATAAFASSGQRNVLRTAQHLVECIWPLVRISTNIRIVEPHFDPVEPRFKNPIVRLIDRLHHVGRKLTLELHVLRLDREGNDRFTPKTVENYRRELDPELPSGLQIHVFFWAHSIQKLHPRYLLTDKGGIKLDHGWDEGDAPGLETPAMLLQEALWQEEYAKYQIGSQAFHLDPAKHIIVLGIAP